MTAWDVTQDKGKRIERKKKIYKIISWVSEKQPKKKQKQNLSMKNGSRRIKWRQQIWKLDFMLGNTRIFATGNVEPSKLRCVLSANLSWIENSNFSSHSFDMWNYHEEKAREKAANELLWFNLDFMYSSFKWLLWQ